MGEGLDDTTAAARELSLELDEPDSRRVLTDVALAPGSLKNARDEDRRRWLHNLILDLVLGLGALLLPALVAFVLLAPGTESLLFVVPQPLVALLLLPVLARRPEYTFGLLRGARLRRFAEAGLFAVLLGLAMGLLSDSLETMLPPRYGGDPVVLAAEQTGPVLALLAVALFPAFFEELLFRGLLLGRLAAYWDAGSAAWVSAAVFAVMHGPTIALLPLFVGGVYLARLRFRSGSLLPGMLAHALYNATILLLA